MDSNRPSFQEIVMTEPTPRQYPSQQHVPYYDGPPAETFAPHQPLLPKPRSRAPFVAMGVTAVAALTAGAALLVARPWHHDPAPVAASPVAHASASTAVTPQPAEPRTGPVLEHTYVEKFLVDLEDATAPVCNRGVDVAAKVGRVITCVEAGQKWTVRITEVEPGGGVRWELVD
jgi:hypothetical protein